jgi:hypothetical protein
MKALYIGPVRDFSGYSTAARGYIKALHDAGVDLVVRPVRYDQADPGTAYKPTDLERQLLTKDLNGVDVVIQHCTPNEMRPVDGKINIAVVAWETTRIPQYWVDKLNKFDGVITFCQASVEAFRDSGVTVPTFKVPHTFDISSYNLDGIESISATSDPEFLTDKFVFYNISQFSAKKGIDVLLRSYLTEFHGHKDVILILKTYINMGGDRNGERDRLRAYIDGAKQGMRLPADGYPPVMVVTKTLTEEQVKKLHKTGDCYVCSSRGEGWCLPAFDALAYGNKLVTTSWGGMGEFAFDTEYVDIPEGEAGMIPGHYPVREIPKNNVYPVRYSMEPLVGQGHADPELYTSFDKIAEPSVSSMMNQMRSVYEARQELKPAPDMKEFDYSVIGPKMLEVIEGVVADKQEASNV